MFDRLLETNFQWFPDLNAFNDFTEKKLKCSTTLPEVCFIGSPSMEQIDYIWLHQNDSMPYKLNNGSVVDIHLIPDWISTASFTDITILTKNDSIVGWTKTTTLLAEFFLQERKKNIQLQNEVDNIELDLKSILETTFDVIFVADGQGVTLKASSACEQLWGYKPKDIIGKSVYELEKENVFNPSVTRLVLERKEKVSVVQKTKTGKILLATGTPIKDETGNIIRVVNGSRDITETEELHKKLNETRSLMEWYKNQLDEITPNIRGEIIYQSPQMEKIMNQAKKVSEVDTTVLITGESGVGKEGIAGFIHYCSVRAKKPFVKINCGSISETLIESELFGYERGAFTGASKEGKVGLIELAHQGTLFLDEIGELPLNLQVKLLRVLQERELTRVGATVPIKVDIRIIAATNRDLLEAVEQGTFREDLYYRLNIIPIHIPPLRERKEDIIPLINHFQNIFNNRYHRNKQFSNEVIQMFLTYPWKGNIRELKNTIERLIVLTENDVIVSNDLPSIFNNKKDLKMQDSIVVREIIPLKTAKALVECKLMELASQRFGTMSEIAKALEVNQSTVSRISRKVTCKNA